jgi:hypothetical protein
LVLGGAANRRNQAAVSFYNEILNTICQPSLFNEEPNAQLWPAIVGQAVQQDQQRTGQPL